jgi:hypothetical protein
MFCNSGGVANFDEIPVFAMLDLKWDSTSPSCNYGLTFVDRFGDLDFEALAGRKLYDEFGAGKDGIEDYV